MADPLNTILERIEQLQSGLETVRTELRAEFQSGFQEIRSEFQERFDTLHRDFDTLHRHFDVVTEDLRGDIQQVAEGVVQNTEAIEAFKKQNAREHEEIRSTIHLSYSDLDRRVKPLENRMDSVENRVDRLEARAS